MSKYQTSIDFSKPIANYLVDDLEEAVVRFYGKLGFKQTFSIPEEGIPEYVELALDSFTLGIASRNTALEMHGILWGKSSRGLA